MYGDLCKNRCSRDMEVLTGENGILQNELFQSYRGPKM